MDGEPPGMAYRRLLRSVSALMVVASLTLPARSAEPDTIDTLYLLGADDGSGWFGGSPSDPELPATEVACVSGAPSENEKQCPLGGGWTIAFFPRVVLDEPIAWSAAEPLKFHAEISVQGANAAVDVTAFVSNRGQEWTAPAAEVAPGVFEASLEAGGPIDPGRAAALGWRVEVTGAATRIAVATAGRSYVTLPAPVAGRSVPRAIEQDTYAPTPATVAIGERTFEFTDAAWDSWTFDGDLGAARDFTVPLSAPAAAVFAWVDDYSYSYGHAALQGNARDYRTLIQYPMLRLVKGETALTTAERTVAAMRVPAGPFGVRVFRSEIRGGIVDHGGLPYVLRVVAVYGSRTLRAIDWPLPQYRWWSGNLQIAAVCPYGAEPVPQLQEARTFAVGLEWDAPDEQLQRWTFNYELPGLGLVPCGEHGTGSMMRFTIGGERMWMLGPTPSRKATFWAVQTVRFRMTVRYTYAPV